MTSLPTRVAKLLAFDDRDTHSQAMKCGYNSNYPTQHKAFEWGAKSERSRTTALEAALVKAVEALTFYREQSNWSEELNKNYSMIIADGGTRAKEALAEITLAFEKMENL